MKTEGFLKSNMILACVTYSLFHKALFAPKTASNISSIHFAKNDFPAEFEPNTLYCAYNWNYSTISIVTDADVKLPSKSTTLNIKDCPIKSSFLTLTVILLSTVV